MRIPVTLSVLSLWMALTAIAADEGLLTTSTTDDNETTTDNAKTTTITTTIAIAIVDVDVENDKTNKVEEKPCSLYLAPSSIPNGGYGVFTVRSFDKGDILLENDGPDILVVDPYQFTGRHNRLLEHVWWTWQGGMSDTMAMDALIDATDFQIMFGALPNFHTYLSSIDLALPEVVYDDRMADRTKDPGAGAFSYYKGKNFLADRDIAAGEELFLHYGEDWFDDGTSDWDFVPRSADFERDGAKLEQFAKELKQQQGIKDKLVCNGHGKLQSMTLEDYDTLARRLSKFHKKHGMTVTIPKPDNPIKKVDRYHLLPTTVEELVRILCGTPRTSTPLRKLAEEDSIVSNPISTDSKELTFRMAHEVSIQPRTPEWIQQNGICLDNIIPGHSTLNAKKDAPNAPKSSTSPAPTTPTGAVGQGAMAQRFIAKGEIVVATPLLHIPDRGALSNFPVHRIKEVETTRFRDLDTGITTTTHKERTVLRRDIAGIHHPTSLTDKEHKKATQRHEQLLINYCFGHGESSLLLCPVTNVILINHCSDRSKQCGPEGPNAMFQWATKLDGNTQLWLNKTLEEIIMTEEERLLSMEIVATRDIQAGDEIFMDYGPNWEAAWTKHVDSWVPPEDGAQGFEPHVAVTQMNLEEAPLKIAENFRVDNLSDPDTDVFTGCLYMWEDHLFDDEILDKYSIISVDDFDDDLFEFGSYWPCLVVDKDPGHDIDDDDDEDGKSLNTTYTVRIFPSPMQEIPSWHKEGRPLFVTGMPRSAIRFFTKPYRSDQHLPGRFRHHIELRDDMMPKQWKDRALHNCKNEEPQSEQIAAALQEPSFQAGDRVLTLITRYGRIDEEWAAARVVRLSLQEYRYDVEYENGVVESKVPSFVMRHIMAETEQNDTVPKDFFNVGDVVTVDCCQNREWFKAKIVNKMEIGAIYDLRLDTGPVVYLEEGSSNIRAANESIWKDVADVSTFFS